MLQRYTFIPPKSRAYCKRIFEDVSTLQLQKVIKQTENKIKGHPITPVPHKDRILNQEIKNTPLKDDSSFTVLSSCPDPHSDPHSHAFENIDLDTYLIKQDSPIERSFRVAGYCAQKGFIFDHIFYCTCDPKKRKNTTQSPPTQSKPISHPRHATVAANTKNNVYAFSHPSRPYR